MTNPLKTEPCPNCGEEKLTDDAGDCQIEREALQDPQLPLWKITFECSQWISKAGTEEEGQPEADGSVGERREVLIACPGGWQAISDIAKAFLSNLEDGSCGNAGGGFFQPRLVGIERVDQVTVIDLGTLKAVRNPKEWPVEELMSAFFHSTLIE